MSGAAWALSHAAGEVSCHGGEDSGTEMLSGTMSSVTGGQEEGGVVSTIYQRFPGYFPATFAQPGALELGVAVEVFWMGSDHVPPIPTRP